jgi:hypothetical protein
MRPRYESLILRFLRVILRKMETIESKPAASGGGPGALIEVF